jgi:hypothetical protein
MRYFLVTDARRLCDFSGMVKCYIPHGIARLFFKLATQELFHLADMIAIRVV